ncbi:MAG: hypothetical protein E6I11_16875 [Chloroflexi bacterium]|nr:MAG: hypothetical protein E6I11_16875 [Chloroflexota bacterium]TMG11253.1 MAG: hypothetical protein E6I00_10490 [Chloroflexota bacterium]
MTARFAKIYSVVGALMLLEFLAQFYTIASSGFTTVAGQIANSANGSETRSAVQEVDLFAAAHAVIGVFIVPLTILALIALSWLARLPRRTRVLTSLLFLLWLFQFGLAFIGFAGIAPIAGLHGLNALALVGLGIYLVRRNWAFGGRGSASTATLTAGH